jgi:hypothetical protein
MPLTKLQFKPGINREVTSYANEGGWFDCDKVRFYLGFPEKIGGWEKYSSSTYLGTARALHSWSALDGSQYLGVGTHLKYYIEEGGAYNDITPVRRTSSAGDVTFSATDGSSIVTVTDNANGAVLGDWVTFSGAASLGGNIGGAVLDDEFQILSIIDSNTYTIDVSPFVANSSDTGNGGSSTVGAYQVNTGLNVGVGGTGYGAGLFGGTTTSALANQLNGNISNSDTTITLLDASSFPTSGTILINNELITYSGVSSNDLTGCTRGTNGTTAASHTSGDTVILAVGNTNPDDDFTGWGQSAASVATPQSELRIWTHDNFGEDLLLNIRDGGIYYWDKSGGLSSRAVEISTISGANNTPTVAKQILVSDRDRHVLAFGCNPQGSTVQDDLLVRFSDQESFTDWEARSDNTAGDLRIGSGSTFVRAIETKREILIWTDRSLHSMQFIGAPFTFGMQQLSANITIISRGAVAATEDFVAWMGFDNFYIYAGKTQQIPCTVKDKVFLDLNFEQRDKITSGVNAEFGEIWWFYPSASGTGENDRYVVYNYLEKAWYYGALGRTAWIGRGTNQFPIAAGEDSNGDNYLYNHEVGYDDDGSAMTAYIESSQMDIGDGDQFLLTRRLIPDLNFLGSTNSAPTVDFTLETRTYPGANYNQTGTGSVVRSATTPVEQWTNEVDLRLRGRSFALKVESSGAGTAWKLGVPRVDLRPDGRR